MYYQNSTPLYYDSADHVLQCPRFVKAAYVTYLGAIAGNYSWKLFQTPGTQVGCSQCLQFCRHQHKWLRPYITVLIAQYVPN